MKTDDLRKQIDSIITHILFDYNGKPCGIDPINLNSIDMWYGDDDYCAKSVDDAMSYPLFDGKSLNQICDKITNIEI